MRKKRLFALTLMLLLVLGSAMTVHAESEKGTAGWKVEFDGKKMIDNFRAADFTDEISDLQPGDEITFTVDLKNNANFSTNWYMTNEVLRSMEAKQLKGEDGSPRAGAYTYVLTYINSANEPTVLYSNETVGGDETSGSRQGLYEATDSLEDWLFLDTLAPGQAGIMTLRVVLDGETQGNAYQDTLAQLRMNFAVEESTTTTTTTTDNDNQQPEKEVIKTGDQSQIILWSLVALGSGLLILLLAILKRRKDRRAEA